MFLGNRYSKYARLRKKNGGQKGEYSSGWEEKKRAKLRAGKSDMYGEKVHRGEAIESSGLPLGAASNRIARETISGCGPQFPVSKKVKPRSSKAANKFHLPFNVTRVRNSTPRTGAVLIPGSRQNLSFITNQ